MFEHASRIDAFIPVYLIVLVLKILNPDFHLFDFSYLVVVDFKKDAALFAYFTGWNLIGKKEEKYFTNCEFRYQDRVFHIWTRF